VESDIAPFKGLLLGLFFISVGMGLDFQEVTASWQWLVASVVGLIFVKGLIGISLCLFFGIARDVAIRAGLLLAAGGEFAFVILATAMGGGLIEPDVGQFMTFVASFSMMLTPALAILGDRIAKLAEPRSKRLGPVGAELEDMVGHVIVAGFGRVGQTVADMLARERIAYVAIDMDATQIWKSRQKGLPAYFGNVTRPDVLTNVGAMHASAVLLTLEGREDARLSVTALQKMRKKLPIIARASDPAHAKELRELGAKYVIIETLEASLQLGGLVLREVGSNRESVSKLIEKTRNEQYGGIDDWRTFTLNNDDPTDGKT
jgi:CPA2 family monovalent cation:H+ antiporter-2